MSRKRDERSRLPLGRNKRELLVYLLLIFCFLSLINKVKKDESRKLPKICNFSREDCFLELKSLHGSNAIIFFVIANGGSLDLIRNFLCFYRKSKSKAIILIASESPTIVEAVSREYGIPSILMTGLSMESSDLDFGTVEYRKLIYFRTHMVSHLL